MHLSEVKNVFKRRLITIVLAIPATIVILMVFLATFMYDVAFSLMIDVRKAFNDAIKEFLSYIESVKYSWYGHGYMQSRFQHMKMDPSFTYAHSVRLISKNIKKCKIDRKYIDTEFDVVQKAMIVNIKSDSGRDHYKVYAASRFGWVYTGDLSDSYDYINSLPDISVKKCIAEIEKLVQKSIDEDKNVQPVK